MEEHRLEALQALRAAADRRAEAARLAAQASAELGARVREARAAGLSVIEIAAEAGVSRTGVYDFLGGQYGRGRPRGRPKA